MTFGLHIKHHSKRLFLTVAILVFGLLSLKLVDLALAQSVDEAVSTGNTQEKLVIIYDQGVQRTILTSAGTVRQALTAAQIEVDDQRDVVEPGLDTELVDTKYHINIFRARPVTIIDGDRRVRNVTAEQTPTRIAKVADIRLYDEDQVSLTTSGDILNDGADVIMRIDRATLLNLQLYGKKSEIRTRAATVRQLLDEKNIKLGSNDTISVDLDVKIQNGMNIEIWRNGVQTVTIEEEIAFTTEKINDANRAEGWREVRETGQNGAKNVTYEIEMKNGQEVSRREIASVVTKEPKKQVEVVGIKINLPPGSHTDWMAAAGIAESDYGYVNFIITKESTWRVNASNGQYYGLYQTTKSRLAEHGCSGETLHDPICQLRSASIYKSRYGTWADAYNAWKRQGWW